MRSNRAAPRYSCHRCTACSRLVIWRRGSSPIGCRCVCSCRRTSTSGAPMPGESNSGNKAPRAVVLLSGGLDSYTAAAIAKADGYELYALSIRYGQVHAREIDAARAVARALGVARHVELSV